MENAFYPLSLLGNKSKCDARAARARVAATYQVTRAKTRVKLMSIAINTLLLVSYIQSAVGIIVLMFDVTKLLLSIKTTKISNYFS